MKNYDESLFYSESVSKASWQDKLLEIRQYSKACFDESLVKCQTL